MRPTSHWTLSTGQVCLPIQLLRSCVTCPRVCETGSASCSPGLAEVTHLVEVSAWCAEQSGRVPWPAHPARPIPAHLAGPTSVPSLPGVTHFPTSHPKAHSGLTVPQTPALVFSRTSVPTTHGSSKKSTRMGSPAMWCAWLLCLAQVSCFTLPFHSLRSIPGPGWRGPQLQMG